MELFVEVAQGLGLLALGVAQVLAWRKTRRFAEDQTKGLESMKLLSKQLYEREAKRLSEHIKAPIHKR